MSIFKLLLISVKPQEVGVDDFGTLGSLTGRPSHHSTSAGHQDLLEAGRLQQIIPGDTPCSWVALGGLGGGVLELKL